LHTCMIYICVCVYMYIYTYICNFEVSHVTYVLNPQQCPIRVCVLFFVVAHRKCVVLHLLGGFD